MLNVKSLTLLVCISCLCLNHAWSDETPHQRVIKLKGTLNTRDIGGYETADGRELRWGRFYRSDKLSRLTPEDFQALEAIGLKTVIDLRTPGEIERAPTVWQGASPPRILSYPIGEDDGEWFRNQQRLLGKKSLRESDVVGHMVDGYRGIPRAGEESYRKLFALLADESNWPVLIHCSAGKDRTGIATALLFETLGVDRETIMDDYLLTNEVARTHEQASLIANQQASRRVSTGTRINSFKAPGPDVYFPLVGVMPEMLNAFYSGVDEEYGSMDKYLEALGVDQAMRESLARLLIE